MAADPASYRLWGSREASVFCCRENQRKVENQGDAMASLMLIDLSSLFWSAWHASVNEPVSTARQNTISRVHSLASGHDRVAICCDSTGSWRRELCQDYKANRPEKDQQAIEELRQTVESLGRDYVVWRADKYEADDVIATAVRRAPESWSIVIATADKDLMQLVNGRVKVLNTRNGGELMGPVQVAEKFGVQPSQIRDYLALVGDSSDNIKGVPGVGPKTAAAMLGAFGSVDGIYRALDDEPEKFTKPAIKTALLESNQIVDMALKLIELRDAPIEFDEINKEKAPAKPDEAEDAVSDIDSGDETIDDVVEVDQPAALKDAKASAGTEISKALQPAPGQAIARASFEMGLEPTTIGAAYKLATGLAQSRLYARFPNAEAIWAVIIRGREMGLGALTALDSFHVVEGKPVCHAHLIIARAKADSGCEYFQLIESDDRKATYETKHRDDPKPTKLTYTIEQAAAAGLLRDSKSGKPSNWQMRPAEMLRKTCAVQLARIVYPAAAMGLYSAEELGAEI